jgi:hypothetical protein
MMISGNLRYFNEFNDLSTPVVYHKFKDAILEPENKF